MHCAIPTRYLPSTETRPTLFPFSGGPDLPGHFACPLILGAGPPDRYTPPHTHISLPFTPATAHYHPLLDLGCHLLHTATCRCAGGRGAAQLHSCPLPLQFCTPADSPHHMACWLRPGEHRALRYRGSACFAAISPLVDRVVLLPADQFRHIPLLYFTCCGGPSPQWSMPAPPYACSHRGDVTRGARRCAHYPVMYPSGWA